MLAKRSEPKNHHYHPQFLMRGHCFDSKKEKTYYVNGDRPVAERRIERLFCERHGYSKMRDDWVRGLPGAHRKWDASTERYLNEKVEGPTSKLIQRILRVYAETSGLRFKSTEQEKALLVRFFQAQFQRQEPEAMREMANEAIQEGFEATRLECSDDPDWHEFEKVLDTHPDYFRRLVQCEFLGDIDNLHPQDFNDLMQSRISVVQATTHLPKKHLISGRRPIVPFWAGLSGGRLREGNQFIMAVSSNMGIVLETCWRPSNWIYLCRERLPLKEVNKVNDRMYLFSEGEIIGRDRNLLEEVRNRNRGDLLETS